MTSQDQGGFSTDRLTRFGSSALDLYGRKFDRFTEIGSGLLGKLSMPTFGNQYQSIDDYAASGNAVIAPQPSVYSQIYNAGLPSRTRANDPTISPRTLAWESQNFVGDDNSAMAARLAAQKAGINVGTTDSTDAFAARLAAKPWQPNQTGVPAASHLQDLRQQWFQERNQAVQDAVAAVNAQYAGPLDELRQRLSDFQIGDREIQAAYADYQADIGDIGVGVGPAEGLDETRVVDSVNESYHGAEASLGEAFAKIDSDGNPGLSEALAQELNQFQTVITDTLATDLGAMEDLHGLSSAYAEALAGFAYADDVYRADQERTLIKAQMDKAIKDQKDAIARTEKEMAEAAARARQQTMDAFGEFNVDMATMQQETFRQYGLAQGMSEDAIAANWAVIQGIMGEYGTTIGSQADFRSYANQYVNQSNFDKAGLTGLLQRYVNEVNPALDKEAQERQVTRRGQAANRLLNKDWSLAIEGPSGTSDSIIATLNAMGINGDQILRTMWNNPQQYDSLAKNPVLLEGYRIYQETEDNWETIVNTGNRYFTSDQLAVAPSGYTFPVVGFNWGSGGGYGYVKPSGRIHQGVDIGAYRGTPIVAPADGTIESKGWSDTSGWYIRLRDNNGNLHKFMHLDQEPTIGGTVRAGTQIGAVGRTGNAAGGGPHLHYEIWNRGGSSMDPASWLKTTGGWQIGDPPSNWGEGY